MADSEKQSELLASYQLPSGDVVRKIETASGDIQYRRGRTTKSGKQGGSIISNQVGDNIAERAASDVGSDRQVQFIVSPKSKGDRERAIVERYPELERVSNLNPGRIESGQSRKVSAIKHFMQRPEIKKQISKDPLLSSNRERQRAREARARQIVKELENASNEQQRIQILRRFGIDT